VTPRFARTLSWLMPVLCALVIAGVVGRQWMALQALGREHRSVEQDIAVVENSLRQLDAAPPPSRIATEELSNREQVSFLNMLRGYADAWRVRLVRWSNGTPIAPGMAAEGAPNRLPEGVYAIGSAVEVAGAYNDVRRFLYDLQRSPRLYNLSEVRWTRGDKWPITMASFTLTRYVTAAAPGVSSSAAPAGAPAPAFGPAVSTPWPRQP